MSKRAALTVFIILGLWFGLVNTPTANSQGYPSANCHSSEVAPVNKKGWRHGATVNVYIEPTIVGDRRTAISAAFNQWSESAAANGSGVTYNFVSQPPPAGT